MMSSKPEVLVDKGDQIATLTLNRPEKKNALNLSMLQTILRSLKEIDNDSEVRVLIITGAGGCFSSGQDIKEMSEKRSENPSQRRARQELTHSVATALRQLSKPTIAEIRGYCFGAGLRLMALCDFALASDESVFCLPEINFSSIPANGLMWLLSYHMKPRDALYLAMTGERIDASRARTIGLINSVTSSQKLKEEVLYLAQKLKEKNPTALMICKETFRLSRLLDYEQAAKAEVGKWREIDYLLGGESIEEKEAYFSSFIKGRSSAKPQG